MNAMIFLKECKAELEKVSWPTKDEVVKSTGVVLVTVFVFSLFIFITDSLFVWLLKKFWELAG
jgi:preprotein translocase subunit SecE